MHLEGERLSLQEFYVYLGCRFYTACFEGISDVRDWWSRDEINMFEGAPFRLNEYMSIDRFKAITTALRYTDKEPPSFVDRFHDVRQLIDEWNRHYEEEYSPSWLSCLDESMSSWLNKYCPVFMVVPRKPHPCGNEYHTIADGDQGRPVCWRMKLQEGKGRPKNGNQWAFPSKFPGATQPLLHSCWR